MNNGRSNEGIMSMGEQAQRYRELMRNGQQSGFTLIELMVVVAIIGILASIGVPIYYNFVKQAETTDPINNMASIASSVAGMLGTGVKVSDVVTAVNTMVEDPTEMTSGVHNISAALTKMAWTPSAGTLWEYTVAAVANTAGTGVDVCIMAKGMYTVSAGTYTMATTPGYVYFSSVPASGTQWQGSQTNTANFVSGVTTITAGGACTSTSPGTVSAGAT